MVCDAAAGWLLCCCCCAAAVLCRHAAAAVSLMVSLLPHLPFSPIISISSGGVGGGCSQSEEGEDSRTRAESRWVRTGGEETEMDEDGREEVEQRTGWITWKTRRVCLVLGIYQDTSDIWCQDCVC